MRGLTRETHWLGLFGWRVGDVNVRAAARLPVEPVGVQVQGEPLPSAPAVQGNGEQTHVRQEFPSGFGGGSRNDWGNHPDRPVSTPGVGECEDVVLVNGVHLDVMNLAMIGCRRAGW